MLREAGGQRVREEAIPDYICSWMLRLTPEALRFAKG